MAETNSILEQNPETSVNNGGGISSEMGSLVATTSSGGGNNNVNMMLLQTVPRNNNNDTEEQQTLVTPMGIAANNTDTDNNDLKQSTADEEALTLPESTHSFLFTEPINSIPFYFGLGIAAMSYACLILALINNLQNGDVPANVSKAVRIAQYLSILIALLSEYLLYMRHVCVHFLCICFAKIGILSSNILLLYVILLIHIAYIIISMCEFVLCTYVMLHFVFTHFVNLILAPYIGSGGRNTHGFIPPPSNLPTISTFEIPRN